MAKIEMLKFRATKEQRRVIETLAQAQGHVSLSSYLLQAALQGGAFERMSVEICQKLENLEGNIKWMKKNFQNG